MDGHYRKLYFYHHRNKDGLIYRQENIGRKTFEYYKGREDKLVYRSVTFDADATVEATSLKLKENHHPSSEVVINKMTQRFELDPSLPAETQIQKTEFNLAKDMVYIYYHYQEGRITSTHQEWNRSLLITQGKMGDSNEKEEESTLKKQTQQKILDMEVRCHEQIKEYERQAYTEMQARIDSEKTIHQLSKNPNTTELFQKVLEKSVYAKARDKMKTGKTKDEAEKSKDDNNDMLLPILKKLCLPDGVLEEEAAI